MLDTASRPSDWRRALQRASARGLNVEPLGEAIQDNGDEETYFRAASWSNPTTPGHGVRIVANAHGVGVECSCEGACKGYICMHAALALRVAGLLPDAMMTTADESRPTAA